MTKVKKHVICAGCILYRFNPTPEILLIKPRAELDAWGIPKGHKEENESLIDCAIRETWEETGLACAPETQLGSVNTTNPKEHKRVFAFLAQPIDNMTPNPITADEIADIRWWSIDSLPQIHVYQKPLVQRATIMLSNFVSK